MARFNTAVIGCGIYGLMTALKLDAAGQSVLLIDQNAPGIAGAGSSGLTRAAHSLYDDPIYADLAVQSLHAYRGLSPDAVASCPAILFAEDRDRETHARKVIAANAINHIAMDKGAVAAEYPLFKSDYGCMDSLGGVFRMEVIRNILIDKLRASRIQCAFHQESERIEKKGTGLDVHYGHGQLATVDHLVIAAGCGSQGIVDRIDGLTLSLCLELTKPGTLMHFKPRNEAQAVQASYKSMPAFAYIERGVFGLPLIDGYTECVKVAGFYDPAAPVKVGEDTQAFLETHVPFLLDFEVSEPRIKDECFYDYTKDGHFIVGPIPEYSNIILACGWNGGGYKFAPAITDQVADLILSGINSLPKIFDPERLI